MGRENGDYHNLGPTGSLTETIGTSLRPKGTTLNGSSDKPSSSERTTVPSVRALSTGMNAGSSGSYALPTLSQAIAAGDPEAVEAAVLRGLPPLVKSSLRENRPLHPDPMRTCELVGYLFASPMPREDLEQARRLIELANRPERHDVIVRELIKLRFLTVGQSLESDDEAKLALQAYAERLAKYPGDAVLTTLRNWPDEKKWWPAFAELKAKIDAHCERRRMLAQAIEEQLVPQAWMLPVTNREVALPDEPSCDDPGWF
jgi:hypothetical protein